ncbi:hypothetical protein LNTAR_19257 [Lentisphaera araneosa HTCC2155]|uniref:Uncharacterized protein n=1 Tax=Lentisphaera araneosa HTCC2155 TaxID=313628 RepID=A6DQR7_9BACT|nr:hypothetical protein [Lentisphaera araneosa]EDM25967.1 hypothetical protein LNTAR_19257 [Lentisphaera araneosa HTCC2155]
MKNDNKESGKIFGFSILAIFLGLVQLFCLMGDMMSDTKSATIFESLIIPSLIIFPIMLLAGYVTRKRKNCWLIFFISAMAPYLLLLFLMKIVDAILIAIILSINIGLSSYIGTRFIKNKNT